MIHLRNWILCFVICLTLLAVLAIWQFVRNGSYDSTQREPVVAEQKSIQDEQLQNVDKAMPSVGIARLPKSTQIAMARLNENEPIEYYGKVIDQDGIAIAEVSVKLKYARWVLDPQGAVVDVNTPVTLFTDADGRFELTGVTGYRFDIESITRPGYAISHDAFLKENAKCDPRNPVVFAMWKRQGADRLVFKRKNTRIPYDGTPVLIDLMKGKLVDTPPADLRVTLLRTPLERRLGDREPYDWNAKIEVLEGGLVESEEEFMLQAPEQGYLPSLEINVLKDGSDWSSLKVVSFYFHREGRYGRATLEFRTGSDKPTTGISFESYVNPTGSRNLEYDPRQYTSTADHFPPE